MSKEKKSDPLEKLRKGINSVDLQMVSLLDERAQLVKEVGEYKKENDIPIYQPDREKQVKERILSYSKNEFPTKALLHIYTEIVSAARSLEQPLNIGYLGPEGTFSEQATIKHFGSSVILHALPSISDVFHQVENGKLEYGVVPIENSLEGTVNMTLDQMVDSPLKIVSESFLNINQNLLANLDDMSQIKKVYSHPQGLAQCRVWLETNLPNAERIEVSSTAKAASVVPWDKFAAAIASEIAAERFGLNILERNIEDNPENYTRFWVIGTEDKSINNPDKTTALVSVKDKPGALLRLLSPFQVFGINLSKIESRPSRRRPWDYLFYLDIDGSIEDSAVKKALDKVKESSVFLKVLGSYPKGIF